MPTPTWTIRPYHKDDAAGCGEVFRLAVLEGAASHYSEAERQAWAARAASEADWSQRLAPLHSVVAEGGTREVVGFCSLDAKEAYLDLIFVLPVFRGSGLADELLERTVDMARALDLKYITTHASLVARSFFARHGWSEEGRNTVEIGDTSLLNFKMGRSLTVSQNARI